MTLLELCTDRYTVISVGSSPQEPFLTRAKSCKSCIANGKRSKRVTCDTFSREILRECDIRKIGQGSSKRMAS